VFNVKDIRIVQQQQHQNVWPTRVLYVLRMSIVPTSPPRLDVILQHLRVSNPANSMVSNNLQSGDGFSDFLILFAIVFKSVVYQLSLEKCICFHVLKSKKNIQRANKNS